MTIVVPDAGENIALEYLVNKDSPENLVLKLFSAPAVASDPGEAATSASFTEATFTGYSAITLTGASWNAASGGSISYAQQTFTSSADQTAETIDGYYLVRATGGELVAYEYFSDGPYSVENNGDAIKITPTITAS